MRALNEKESMVLHVKFAFHMCFLIILSLFFIFSFIKTSDSEISEIKLKIGDCEKIYMAQIELCDDLDDFFSSYRKFDLSEDVNSEFLMRSVIDKKNVILKKISDLPENDVKVHSFMMSKMDDFLRVRDSISTMKEEERRLKKELFICNGDYVKLHSILDFSRLKN